MGDFTMTTSLVTYHHPTALTVQEGGLGFQRFIQQANQVPVLSAEEEYDLAMRYKKKQDIEAAHRLVHAYLRLVLKTAKEYLNYRLNLPDLVQEGTVGLMHAVKNFDPERGNRFSSYAIWWIRAAIHDFILRSWRMVKIATTRIKRQLFFKLRQTKTCAAHLSRDEAEMLALKFGTDVETILEVDARMSSSDESLNQPVLDGDDGEWIECIPDQRPNPEHFLISTERKQHINALINKGLTALNTREQQIIRARYLAENPQTLDSLSQILCISRERVRQLEKRALEKLRTFLQSSPGGQDLVMVV